MNWLRDLQLDSRRAMPKDHSFVYDSWLRSYEPTFWQSPELAHYPGHETLLLLASAEYRHDVGRGIAPLAARQKHRAARALYVRLHRQLIENLLPQVRVLFHVQQPDEIVAWICGLPSPSQGAYNRVHYLFVKQLFRGQRLGRRLLCGPTLVHSHTTPAWRGLMRSAGVAEKYLPQILLLDADVSRKGVATSG